MLHITSAINNKISYIELISLGSVSATVVTLLEIFNLAILKITENHSRSQSFEWRIEPSIVDGEITKNIIESGKTLGIEVLDHMIILEENYFSFLENNLL